MVDRWYPVDVTQVVNVDGFTITLTTDASCHLFLFYTFQKPWVHPVSVNERGLTMPWWAYWCYVSWIVVEQDEPGDTTVHTFQISALISCNRIWFRFHGTIAGNSSPSDSPIFYKHFIAPSAPVIHDWPLSDPPAFGGGGRWHGQCYPYPISGKPTTWVVWLGSWKLPEVDVIFYLEDAYISGPEGHWHPYVDQTGHILDQVTVPKEEFGPLGYVPYQMTIPFTNPPYMEAGSHIALTMYENYTGTFSMRKGRNLVIGDEIHARYIYPPAGTYRPWVGQIPLDVPWASTVTFTP